MPTQAPFAVRTLQRAGATPLGLPLVRLIAGLARHALVPPGLACRAIEELASRASDTRIVVPVDLDPTHRIVLELDLSIVGCVEVLARTPGRSNERPSLELFRALVRDAATVFDIGANVGLFTYAAACYAPDAVVRAYEPTPALASLIRRNLALNGWAGRANVRGEGVSAVSGALPFYVHAIDVESSFESRRAPATGAAGAITVPVVALDDVFESEDIDPARTVCKIDVEGHEMKVLDGLERTLSRPTGRPTLLMEFLGRAITEERIIERVLEYGLDVYYVSTRPPVRLRSTADFVPVQELGQWNFLLTDRPLPGQLVVSRRRD
ncbi:MAG TPA: FkbM family methyltransferase [Gemmatimonadaceae bacterium]|jgi:FkbM family methyltransferase|nr:FkbM family methyltransferase [Gemmatimonadaceae bacterium]